YQFDCLLGSSCVCRNPPACLRTAVPPLSERDEVPHWRIRRHHRGLLSSRCSRRYPLGCLAHLRWDLGDLPRGHVDWVANCANSHAGRTFYSRMVVSSSRKPGPNSAPALVLGGGYVGMNLIQWMMSDPSSPFRPVGIIDDDPN